MEIDRSTPKYLKPDDVDTLARQNLQLMTELWIAKDRLMMLEKLLEKAGVISREDLDSYVPEGNVELEVQQERRAYLERLMGANPDNRSMDSLSARAVKKPKD